MAPRTWREASPSVGRQPRQRRHGVAVDQAALEDARALRIRPRCQGRVPGGVESKAGGRTLFAFFLPAYSAAPAGIPGAVGCRLSLLQGDSSAGHDQSRTDATFQASFPLKVNAQCLWITLAMRRVRTKIDSIELILSAGCVTTVDPYRAGTTDLSASTRPATGQHHLELIHVSWTSTGHWSRP